jgi:hypothetical protein
MPFSDPICAAPSGASLVRNFPFRGSHSEIISEATNSASKRVLSNPNQQSSCSCSPIVSACSSAALSDPVIPASGHQPFASLRNDGRILIKFVKNGRIISKFPSVPINAVIPIGGQDRLRPVFAGIRGCGPLGGSRQARLAKLLPAAPVSGPERAWYFGKTVSGCESVIKVNP